MIDPNALVLEVNVRDGQSTELRYTQSGVEQNVDSIVILAVAGIVFDEIRKNLLNYLYNLINTIALLMM